MKRLSFLIAVLVLLLTACSTSTPDTSTSQQPTQQASAEDTLFQNHCSTCHGGNLEGGYGPSLQHVGSKYSKDQILAIMKNGKGAMPSQAFISQADRDKLATWLANKK